MATDGLEVEVMATSKKRNCAKPCKLTACFQTPPIMTFYVKSWPVGCVIMLAVLCLAFVRVR